METIDTIKVTRKQVIGYIAQQHGLSLKAAAQFYPKAADGSDKFVVPNDPNADAKVKKDPNVIYAYGPYVGANMACPPPGPKVMTAAMQEAFDNATGDVLLRGSSPGGSVIVGIEVIGIIDDYRAKTGNKVIYQNDSLTASIAVMIALACDGIKSRHLGTIMIHPPSYEGKSAKQLRELADNVDDFAAEFSNEFVTRAGVDRKLADEWMNTTLQKDRYFIGKKQLDTGIVDELIQPPPRAAKDDKKKKKYDKDKMTTSADADAEGVTDGDVDGLKAAADEPDQTPAPNGLALASERYEALIAHISNRTILENI